jgi:hypothetical protein
MITKILVVFVALAMILSPLYSQTRTPAVAGQWYPAKKGELENLLTTFFENIKLDEDIKELEPFGLIAPHAGYMYSGQVAAYSYSLLAGKKFDTVILIGPSHHFHTGKISIYNGDAYKTPLGDVPVNTQMVKAILDADENCVFQPQVHLYEHSLESQLPFLQYQLENFSIVPILVSTSSIPLLDKLANTLVETIQSDDKVLLIASTDMSHNHPYRQACEIDRRTIELIIARHWDNLHKEILSGRCELCGYFAVYPFIKVMQAFGSEQGVLLKYANSGDATQDTTARKVVGYCSIAFPKIKDTGQTQSLTEEDRIYMLSLARQSIKHYLTKGEILKTEPPQSPILLEDRAVFVTLYKNGELRGCVGQIIPQQPLYQAIIDMAVASAFQDYRFYPLRKEELDNITIEISVLTPLKRVENIDEIKLGRDGVFIKKGSRSGVFLPQVAEETGWDKKTFLENLCSQKAFLPKDAYLNPDTEIYIFQVEEFSE